MSGTAVFAATAAGVALAITATGVPVNHISANDGGVWSTDNDPGSGYPGSFSEYVVPIKQLSYTFATPASARAPSYDLNVYQAGTTVLAEDLGQGYLYPVDTVSGTVDQGAGISIPPLSRVGMAGGVAALLAPSSSTSQPAKVWAEEIGGGTDPDLSGLNPRTSKPLAEVEDGLAIAVDQNGDVFLATPTDLVEFPFSARKEQFGSKLTFLLGFPTPPSLLQLTTVGTTPAVLDSSNGDVEFPESSRRNYSFGWSTHDSEEAEVQQPGPSASSLLVATANALWSVPINGHPAQKIATALGSGGTPAAPVSLDGCAFAAWAGSPGSTVRDCTTTATGKQESPLAVASLIDPVFRVNNGEIILNDVADGAIWTVTGEPTQTVTPQDWLRVLEGNKSGNSKTVNPTQSNPQETKRQPKLKNKTLLARPGRSSILHVLDGDTDPGRSILSIESVSPPSGHGFSVEVSPDTQSVLLHLDSDQSAPVTFDYTVVDGFRLTASGPVTVVPSTSPSRPVPPAKPTLTRPVVSGGTVTMQVLGNWRDTANAPLSLASASVPSRDGSVSWTSDGLITYVAASEASNTPVTIAYQVTDGYPGAATVRGQVPLTLLGRADTSEYPPTAEPDAVKIAVGQPTQFAPLANDIFGADPNNAGASLSIAGTISSPSSPPGLEVGAPSPLNGDVLLTASRSDVYSLQYRAAYGSAISAPTQILVQAVVPPGGADTPVVTPTSVVVHGQWAVTVDVLASAYDPAGNVLTVTSATAPQGYSGTVEDGEFLRVQPTTAAPPSSDEVFTYQVSNGVTPAVTGQLTVIQQPALAATQPVVPASYVTVRAGSEVDIPVLADASDPDGEPIYLQSGGRSTSATGNVPTSVWATQTAPGTPYPGGNGSASVAGAYVRYAAPDSPSITSTESITVSFLADAPYGGAVTGEAYITVVPGSPSYTSPPEPQEVDARVTSGGTVTIPIPTTGVDPDGDAVTVIGIGSGPQLGRIMSWNANSITYQAFPTAPTGGFAGGTDSFEYTVENPEGQPAEALIRVGITSPGQPQPPIAVDKYVTAAPSSQVRVGLLQGDIVSANDHVTVEPLSQTANEALPSGTSLVGGGPDPSVLQTRAPQGPALSSVTYGISDGVSSSTAQVFVQSEQGYVTPPSAIDYFPPAPAAGGAPIVMNVLKGDSDPAGGHLLVSTPVSGVTVEPGSQNLSIPVSDSPRAIPYVVRSSASGAEAVGVVHALAGAAGPQLKQGSLITVPANGSIEADLSDYLTDPGHVLEITSDASVRAAPALGLGSAVRGTMRVELTDLRGYQGPGSLTVQIVNALSPAAAGAITATFSIPVQVGRSTPIVRCPSTPIQVIEGGASVDATIASVCQVWTPNNTAPSSVSFTASWKKTAPGVAFGWHQTGRVISLQAGSNTLPGTTGIISVEVPGGDPATGSTLEVQVVKAGLAQVLPMNAPPVKTGQTATVHAAQFVHSPLLKPEIYVVSATPTLASDPPASKTGAIITISPQRGTHGTLTYSVIVSDEGPSRADRDVPDTLTLQVLDVPSVPTGVTAQPGPGEVHLQWAASQDNGAPIEYYNVYATGRSEKKVSGTSYTWTGLTDRTTYSFTVAAVNEIGSSHPSVSVSAAPKGTPGAPTGVTAVGHNESAQVSWHAPNDNGEAIKYYTVNVSPAIGRASRTVSGSSLTLDWTGLSNSSGPYSFTVVARNSVGPGPPSTPSSPRYAHGEPNMPPAPAAAGKIFDGNQGETEVTVSWPAISDCNDDQTCAKYVVSEYKQGTPDGSLTTTGACGSGSDLCANFGPITNDGSDYTYTIEAVNVEGQTSHPSLPSKPSVPAVGAPGMPTISGETDGNQEATIDVVLPQSNDTSLTTLDYTATPSSGAALPGSWSNPGNWSAGQTVPETISGLSNTETYSVLVSACNASKCGLPSNNKTVSPYGSPNPPTVESETSSGNTIDYSWVAGAYNGRSITSFSVCVGSSESGDPCSSVTASTSDPSQAYTGSQSFACSTTIYVYIYAHDSANQESAESNETSTNTGACQSPSAPGTPGASSTSENSINWTWSAGSALGASSYYYSTSFSGNVGTATSATQGGLNCGTGYTASVTIVATYPDGTTAQAASGPGSASTSSCSTTFTLTLSSSPASSVCSDCHWVDVAVTNFPTGDHSYTCYFSGSEGGTYSGKYDVTSPDWTYDPSGSTANGCAIGRNESVYMVMDGYTSTKASSP